MRQSRRRWLTSAASAGLLAGFTRLHALPPAGGALQPVADDTTGLPLLRLPPGFSYSSLSWAGDPMEKTFVPSSHDGTGAFTSGQTGEVVLMRNHEQDIMPRILGADLPIYDDFSDPAVGLPGLGGGVTRVRVRQGIHVETRPVLAGTVANCAGGPTPWGSWLSCEEVVLRGSRLGAKDHGYVFEVPVTGRASAVPIKAMGLFRHEAAAVHSESAVVYLTEDNGMHSGFYRFIPNDPRPLVGALEQGGTLQMLKVRGTAQADLRNVATSQVFDVEWVTIDEPDMDPEGFAPDIFGGNVVGTGKSGPFLQGEQAGGAVFARLEGCWAFDGMIYFADTAGGPVDAGTIWCFDPRAERLLAFFTSTAYEVADALDNVTLADNGTIIVCEDNSGLVNEQGQITQPPRLLAIRSGASVQTVAQNNVVIEGSVPGRPAVQPGDYRGSEWTGATFSPDGKTLYANIQTPGITFAIRGPWSQV